jgi:hypothetical protein
MTKVERLTLSISGLSLAVATGSLFLDDEGPRDAASYVAREYGPQRLSRSS